MTIDEYIEVLKTIREESLQLNEDLSQEQWRNIFDMSVDMIGFVQKAKKVISRDVCANFLLDR